MEPAPLLKCFLLKQKINKVLAHFISQQPYVVALFCPLNVTLTGSDVTSLLSVGPAVISKSPLPVCTSEEFVGSGVTSPTR